MKVKNKQVNKSRKQQRKNDRKAKKARKHEYFTKIKERNDLKKQEKKKPVNTPPKPVLIKNKMLNNKPKIVNKTKAAMSLQEEQLQEIKMMNKQTKELKKEIQKERKKQLKREAAADDLEIKSLEKRLGLNKMKEKSKLAFFAADGLDYLLDVCDRSKLKDTGEVEKRFKEGDEDFGDDFAMVTGNQSAKKKVTKEKRQRKENSASSDSEPEEQLSTKASSKLGNKRAKNISEGSDSDEDLSGSGDEFDDSDISDEDSSIDENIKNNKKRKIDGSTPDNQDSKNVKKILNIKNDTDNKSKSKIVKPKEKIAIKESDIDHSEGEDEIYSDDEEGDGLSFGSDLISDDDVSTKEKPMNDDGMWEDIYGRMRDKQGNVVAKYQPPHLRKNADENVQNDGKLSRLKKQLKGLLNRLAENNMVSISSQIEVLYGSNSRNDMNETLWNLYRESLLGESASPERLVAEHAMLLAVLSANVGGEVSAHCLQKCVMEWHRLWTSGADVHDKTTNNTLHLLSYMFHFKLFHCTLLYDIMELLLGKLEEKEVELILLVLRTVGFSLRKEDPIRLKDFVLKAQKLANDATGPEGSRVKFLLETILAIKNNNMSKIANYNPEYAEHLKKTLKASVRKGNYNAELKISLEDLLKADERGRWWVVGSAWTGELPGEKEVENIDKKPLKSIEGFSSKLLELAKKQRMNTDTRRVVFCVIMSAEDYLDAFEKLLKLGLKGPPEREIMNVILHCLLQEKQFNPYYEHLARRFCVCDRRFQVMLQYAAWDRIQELKSLAPTQVTNLAKFLGRLILEKNLALSVLKVVEFGELDKASVRFIRQILLSILLAESEESMISVFGRIAGSKPLKLFREGLRLFLHHFVLRNSKDVEGADMALLTIRVKLADSALSAADRSLAF